jgi:hypothetical protein
MAIAMARQCNCYDGNIKNKAKGPQVITAKPQAACFKSIDVHHIFSFCILPPSAFL